MNTLDDLRSTLAGHADDPIGTALDPRVTAVHARIARVRRQRRAALAGGVAAVVLAVAGVITGITLPGHQTAGPAPIAGHALPDTVDVYGFGYRLGTTAQSDPGDRRLTLKLPASDRDRVVSLVGTGLGTGYASLNYTDNAPPDIDRTTGDSALDHPIPIASDKTSLTVTITNASPNAQVGLAVYDRTGAMPAGVAGDGAVFRDRIGGHTLLAGAFGKAGRSEVTITFQGPVRKVQLVGYCRSADKKAWYDVSWDGAKHGLESQCEPNADDDAGAVGGGSPAGGFGPGMHTVTIRTMASGSSHARPVDVPDAVLGVAAYRIGAQTRVLGTGIDNQIEANGRTWVLDRVVPVVGDRATVPPATTPLFIGEAFRGGGTVFFTYREPDGRTSASDRYENGVGVGATWGQYVPAGDSEQVKLHMTRPEGRAALLIFRPSD